MREDRFHRLADALPQMVWLTDARGNVEYLNARWVEYFGSRDKGLGHEWVNQIHPDDRVRTLEVFERSLATGETYQIEYRLLGKNGEYRWFMGRALPIRGLGGRIHRWIGTYTDIHERKVFEEMLHGDFVRSRRFYFSLVENIPNMVFVKDAKELRFVSFNRAGERLLGTSRSEMIGKNDYDFFPKEQADFFVKHDREVLASGMLEDIPEETISTRSGVRVLHTKKLPILDSEGRPEYLLGISEDITEIKRAEEERFKLLQEQAARIEAEKAVGIRNEFLSIASHELKTPITSLHLQLQMLLRSVRPVPGGSVSADFLEKQLEMSICQVERLTRLIEELLDVSRIEQGKLVLACDEVDLKGLLEEVVERFEESLRQSGSVCEFSVLEPITVFCDRFRIEQVIVNLLTNAMKYGGGRPIRISAWVNRDRDSVGISVSDEGEGISPEHLGKIFDRFERAGASPNIGGLGLGLFISRQIVEAHKGRISVESELGRGSVFTVELPILACAP